MNNPLIWSMELLVTDDELIGHWDVGCLCQYEWGLVGGVYTEIDLSLV